VPVRNVQVIGALGFKPGAPPTAYLRVTSCRAIQFLPAGRMGADDYLNKDPAPSWTRVAFRLDFLISNKWDFVAPPPHLISLEAL
jgi:hypothetical protein